MEDLKPNFKKGNNVKGYMILRVRELLGGTFCTAYEATIPMNKDDVDDMN